MRTAIILNLAVLLAVAGLHLLGGVPRGNGDRALVYAAVLEDYFRENRRTAPLIVDGRTERADDSPRLRGKLSMLRPRRGAVNDFVGKNQTSVPIPQPLPTSVPIRFFTEEDAKAIRRAADAVGSDFYADWWRAFYRHFPDAGACLGMSSVGFSNDGRQAVVVLTDMSGALTGDAMAYLYEWDDHRWRRVRQIPLWMA